MESIVAFVMGLASQYPILATVLMIIGVLRLVNKPLMTMLGQIVEMTPSPKDNELYKAVLESKIYIGVTYVLDLFGSVKAPQLEKK